MVSRAYLKMEEALCWSELPLAAGARVAVAEVPPGPPVLQTLVAEIYGPNETSRMALANQVREIFRKRDDDKIAGATYR